MIYEFSWQYWLILSMILLGAEVLLGTFFLLIPAISGFLTTIICCIFNIVFLYDSLIVFIISLLLCLLLSHFRNKTSQSLSDEIELMNKLIGHKTILLEKIDEELFRVKLGDSYWQIRVNNSELKIGDKIEIIGYQGITLLGKASS